MKRLLGMAALSCISSHLFSLTVDSNRLKAELADAKLIAKIEITEVKSVSDPKYFVSSEAKARVLEIETQSPSLSVAAGDLITLQTLGGEVGELGTMLPGYPRPRTFKQYTAYLNPILSDSRSNVFEITGFEAGLIPIEPERDYSRNRTDGSNGQGNGPYLYWDRSFFPLAYYVSAPTLSGHPDFLPAIDASFQAWQAVAQSYVDFRPMGCSNVVTDENDGISGVILIRKNWPFDPAAIAITRNFYVGGESPKAGLILDSDILLNGADHDFTTTNEPGKYDVQDIVTHEVGHFLGLGHEVNPIDAEATMYAIAAPNEFSKRTLKADDIAGIRSAYDGVATKQVPYASQCAIAAGNVGCLSVAGSQSATERKGWVAFAFLLLNWIVLGRWYYKVERKEEQR